MLSDARRPVSYSKEWRSARIFLRTSTSIPEGYRLIRALAYGELELSRKEGKGIVRMYKAVIWIGDKPGRRVTLAARSLREARVKLEAEYGTGYVISIWNEEDAERPRQS